MSTIVLEKADKSSGEWSKIEENYYSITWEKGESKIKVSAVEERPEVKEWKINVESEDKSENLTVTSEELPKSLSTLFSNL